MTRVICDEYCECTGCKWKYADKYSDIDEEYRHCAHLIEIAEVKHGEWEYEYDDNGTRYHYCSQCTTEIPVICCDNFCPACGAKMDLKEAQNDARPSI